jgi:ribosomal protein S18 acetylase RimI-like enzyme
MNDTAGVRVRPMTTEDVARLTEIDANFNSPLYLDVVKEAQGLNVTWRLIERPLDKPFVCTDFVFDARERRDIGRRLKSGQGLWLVAEAVESRSKRLVGMLDVERQAWRAAGWVWNVAVDRACRGQGLGRELLGRAIKWGQSQDLRAIMLETQTNNWPACCFYRRLGFQLTGLDDHFYTNHDVANKEVALFWTYEL